MKKALILLIAAASLAAPASALAVPQLAVPIPTVRLASSSTSTQNVAPNRRALGAYETYLTALLANTPAAQAAETSFIATISGSNGCKSSLAPLTQPSQQVSTQVQHTLNLLGKEMGDDLSIAFDQSAMPAFTKFSTTLLRLHWVRFSGAIAIVKRYVNAETALLQMAPSDLCQDALLAGAYPQKVPDGTRTFVRSFDAASSLANTALANLTKMMQSYEVPSEKNLVAHITTLAGQVAAATRSSLLQSGTVLSAALETA